MSEFATVPGHDGGTIYRTREGDMLDAILFKAFGHHDGGLLAATLTLNPGLADQPPILPAGLFLTLPKSGSLAPKPEIKLWD